MKPTATICRAQEARQHLLAANAILPNVRQVAMLAAAAWAKEGLLAEKRESRMIDRRLPIEVEDRAFSENPDRDHANAEMMHA